MKRHNKAKRPKHTKNRMATMKGLRRPRSQAWRVDGLKAGAVKP